MIIYDPNEAETNEHTTDQASYADDFVENDQTVEEPQINHKPKRKTDKWYSVDKILDV